MVALKDKEQMLKSFHRESIMDYAAKEIEYILTSTHEKYALDPKHPSHRRVMDALCTSLKTAVLKDSSITTTNPAQAIRQTNVYKIAQIVKTADTQKEFCEMLALEIPRTKGYISQIMHWSKELHWAPRFDVQMIKRNRPSKNSKTRASKTHSGVKIEKPGEEAESLHVVVEELTVLKKEVKELRAHISTISGIIAASIAGSAEKAQWVHVLTMMGVDTRRGEQ